jgi:hypothetical protein
MAQVVKAKILDARPRNRRIVRLPHTADGGRSTFSGLPGPSGDQNANRLPAWRAIAARLLITVRASSSSGTARLAAFVLPHGLRSVFRYKSTLRTSIRKTSSGLMPVWRITVAMSRKGWLAAVR